MRFLTLFTRSFASSSCACLISGTSNMCLMSLRSPFVFSTVTIWNPKSVSNGSLISPSCKLKATSLNSFTKGVLRSITIKPPSGLEAPSSVYKTALVAKLLPFSRISLRKPLRRSITFWRSSSVAFGSITIRAISSSTPNVGSSSAGIFLKNVFISSGVTSTDSTIF